MSNHEAEIALDVEELTRLQQLTERTRVKAILAAEIEKLCSSKSSSSAQDAANESVPTEVKAAEAREIIPPALSKTIVAPPKYYYDVTTYAWDQSDKFMKIYVTLKGVQKLTKESLSIEFKNKSFQLQVENLDGKNYRCHVGHLWGNIVPAESYHKVKSDMVLVMLKKSEEKRTWAYVTEREDKKKTPKMDEKKDPNDGLMDLMKQLYEDGDDEMKRTIAKSFSESRNKTAAAMGGDL